MNKVAYYLVLFVGGFTCFSFFPHAFLGMEAVKKHIAKGEIQTIAANGMQEIWLYSSIMMLLSGIWLLFLSKRIKNGDLNARLQVVLIGAGLTAFGVGCIYIKGNIDAMIMFLIQGILLLFASLVFFKSEKV